MVGDSISSLVPRASSPTIPQLWMKSFIPGVLNSEDTKVKIRTRTIEEFIV